MKKLLIGLLPASMILAFAIPSFADYSTEVPIDESTFPDEIFREYVMDNFDYDADGSLSESECADVIDPISVSSMGITSLKGIEHFTELTDLDCYNNKLTELDLSKNTALHSVDCTQNPLETLVIGENANLETLLCGDTLLTALDLSNCTSLASVSCMKSQLTTLNLSNCTSLKNLLCAYNNLTTLDLNDCTSLVVLGCYNNRLTALDMSKNLRLSYLRCEYNQLTSLDLSKLTPQLGDAYYPKSLSKTNLSYQIGEGTYRESKGKYIVDLTQFDGVDPEKVTVTDGGVRNGNIVTYDEKPKTMTYNYATGVRAVPELPEWKEIEQMEDVVITLSGQPEQPEQPEQPGRQVFTVSFDIDGGSAVDSQQVVEGDVIDKPEDPIKPSFTFCGTIVAKVVALIEKES